MLICSFFISISIFYFIFSAWFVPDLAGIRGCLPGSQSGETSDEKSSGLSSIRSVHPIHGLVCPFPRLGARSIQKCRSFFFYQFFCLLITNDSRCSLIIVVVVVIDLPSTSKSRKQKKKTEVTFFFLELKIYSIHLGSKHPGSLEEFVGEGCSSMES